jgi:hypothetical protein
MITDRHHEPVTIPDQACPNARPRTPMSVSRKRRHMSHSGTRQPLVPNDSTEPPTTSERTRP